MKPINIPDIIRARRAELGLSQIALAKRIGLRNRWRIADWETGRSRVPAEMYLKIMSLRSRTTTAAA